MRFIWLLMFALLLVPFAFAADHPDFPDFSAPHDVSVSNGSLLVVDDAVFRGGWYASNGDAAWTEFFLGGEFYNNNSLWIHDVGNYTLPSFGEGEHYVLVYSCSYDTGWDCHGTTDKPEGFWQLYIIHNTNPELTTPIDAGAESLLLAGVPLIHDQTFLIPENAEIGDTIGDLNLMWVSPEQNIIYSLEDDDGHFALQRLEGRDTVSNHLLNYEIRIALANDNLDYDAQAEHQIILRATDQNTAEYRDATITIKLSKEENTVFVDPSWTGCQEGTKECPYDSWIEDISGGIWNWGRGIMTPGTTYVQKRNTIYGFRETGNQDYYGFTIEVNGTPSEHIVIGAYGSGDRPIFASIYRNDNTNTYGGGRGISISQPLSYYDFYSLAFTNTSVGIITSQMGFNQLTYTDLHFFDNHGVGIYSWVTERNANPPFTQDDVDTRYGRITDSYAEGMGYAEGVDTMPNDNYGFKLAGPQRMDISYTVVRHNEKHGFSNAASSTEFRYCQAIENDYIGIKAHGNDILIDHTLIADNKEIGISHGNYYANYGLSTTRFYMTNSLVYGGERGMDIQENVTDGLIENSVFRDFTEDPDTYQGASALRIVDTDPYSTNYNPPTNFTIRNNIFQNSDGHALYIGDNSDPIRKFRFYNNVFTDNGDDTIYIQHVDSLEIYNNVLYNNEGTYDISTRISYPMEGVIIRNNLLDKGNIQSNYMTDPIIEYNIVHDDSFFVDAANGDFSLVSNSPAIDAGINVGLPFQGDAPDIGAVESSYTASSFKTYYVAPDGNDNNPGTIDAPWYNWSKAFHTAQSGDTVLFRGGTYYTNVLNGRGIVYNPDIGLGNNGTEENPIHYFAYPGEEPVLDCSNALVDDDSVFHRGISIYNTEFVHVKGLKVKSVHQDSVGNDYNGQMDVCYGIDLKYNNNIILENIEVYDVHGIGFQLGEDYHAEIINCDSHDNNDIYAATPGDYGMGFAGGGPDDFTEGYTYYYGNRAWNNSDQGFSSATHGRIVYDTCWSFGNGDEAFPGGDGHGWKIGYWYSPQTVNDPTIVIKNSIAAGNGREGIAGNEHSFAYTSPYHLYNNFIYQNGRFGLDMNDVNGTDEDELRRTAINNIAYDNTDISKYPEFGGQIDVNVAGLYTHYNNSWDSDVIVTDEDFVNLDISQLYRPRKADGSLPDITFGHLAEGSDLIDAGTNIGFPFESDAPDLGAFEFVE